jgi:hypothetical protein
VGKSRRFDPDEEFEDEEHSPPHKGEFPLDTSQLDEAAKELLIQNINLGKGKKPKPYF